MSERRCLCGFRAVSAWFSLVFDLGVLGPANDVLIQRVDGALWGAPRLFAARVYVGSLLRARPSCEACLALLVVFPLDRSHPMRLSDVSIFKRIPRQSGHSGGTSRRSWGYLRCCVTCSRVGNDSRIASSSIGGRLGSSVGSSVRGEGGTLPIIQRNFGSLSGSYASLFVSCLFCFCSLFYFRYSIQITLVLFYDDFSLFCFFFCSSVSFLVRCFLFTCSLFVDPSPCFLSSFPFFLELQYIYTLEYKARF